MALSRNAGRYVGILRTTGCERTPHGDCSRCRVVFRLGYRSRTCREMDRGAQTHHRNLSRRHRQAQVDPGGQGRRRSRQRETARARAGNDPPPTIDDELSVGAVGTLPGLRFKLRERVSGDEARIGIGRRSGRIDVMLTRFDFSKMVAGQIQNTEECFIVTETRTYQSVAGPAHGVRLGPLRFHKGAGELSPGRRPGTRRGKANRSGTWRSAWNGRGTRSRRRRPEARRKRTPPCSQPLAIWAKPAFTRRPNSDFAKSSRTFPGTPLAAEAQKELDALPPH